MSRRGHRGRLYWRIYAHGAVLLLAVTVVLGTLAWTLRDQSPWAKTPDRMATLISQELGTRVNDPKLLAARLERLAFLLHLDVAAYTLDGRRLGAAGPNPPAALPPAEARALDAPRGVRGFHHTHATALSPESYLVMRWRGAPRGRNLIWLLALLLGLLALMSWPLARRIARPLEHIAATARAIGAGDLEARTGLARRGEVGELAGAIDEMATRLARLRAHEKALLANVSHELRTPMARIRVGLEWAEEEGGLPRPLEGLGADLAELESLVEDVLATARLDPEEGDFALDASRQPVRALIADAVTAFARREPTREIIVRAEAGDLSGDPRLLRRVLANLLDNAARYAGGEAPVEIEAHRGADGWHLAVLDRGVGVAPADLPRLFEPFFRADASRARATGGVGLGLTLCRRIVEAHGGRIGAELREGGGLRVWFSLPA